MTTLAQTLAVAEDFTPELPPKIAEAIKERATIEAVQRIGGFPITDPLLVEDRIKGATARRALAIEQYNNHKAKMKAELTAMGIEKFIAIVPTVYWKNLCDRHGLFTVVPNQKGLIQVSTKKAYELTEAAQHWWHETSSTIGAITLAATAIFFAIQFVSQTFWANETKWAAVLIPMAIAASWLLHKVGNKRGHNAVCQHLKTAPHGQLLDELFNTGYGGYAFSPTVELLLPAPPLEVVLLLRKLRDSNHGFKVTAEPTAIQLNPSIEELYLKGYQLERERMRKEAQWLADPIITVERGSVTAVLAQFGDFQWEKEVIEEIVGTIPLPVAVTNS